MRRRTLAHGLASLAVIAICFHGSLVRAQTVEQGQAVEQESEKPLIAHTVQMWMRLLLATCPP